MSRVKYCNRFFQLFSIYLELCIYFRPYISGETTQFTQATYYAHTPPPKFPPPPICIMKGL